MSNPNLPSVARVEEALDTRIALGDMTNLLSTKVSNPLEYIAMASSVIAEFAPERGNK